MKSFKISHIEDPTPDHAKQILALTRQDLYEVHVPERRIKNIADPSNEVHVKRQLEKLEKNLIFIKLPLMKMKKLLATVK